MNPKAAIRVYRGHLGVRIFLMVFNGKFELKGAEGGTQLIF